jgi:hypothetical protein
MIEFINYVTFILDYRLYVRHLFNNCWNYFFHQKSNLTTLERVWPVRYHGMCCIFIFI